GVVVAGVEGTGGVTSGTWGVAVFGAGLAVETQAGLLPWDHENGKPALRLYNRPVNDFSDTVMVVKLEFDHPAPWTE
nr:hypothetical protein [Candidatus Hydrogenedentota bacterium]